MAALRVNELESLKKVDVSSQTEKRRGNHARNIELLTTKVEADTAKLEKGTLKRSKTVAVAQRVEKVTVARASPMKEGETRRLIYARRVMDYEFDKCINNQVSKWYMVADLWNNGFTAKKKILAGVQEDVVFPALPDEEHATGARL